MRALIIGCGYVGLPLGAELVRRRHEVHGMRRSTSTCDLQRAGIRPIIGDVTEAEGLERLVRGFDWVINTVSSSRGGLEDYRAIYLEGTRNLLAALSAAPPAKYIFTSSTSVYGQTDGSIVTEQSPTEPASPTSRVLIETEHLLRQAHARNGFPSIIVRLAGIYGPGRGYLFQQYLADQARIAGKGERFINMVHIDDVVGGLMTILENGRPGEIYNLADDEPVTQLQFFEWLAAQLGKPMPPSATEADAMPRKRGLTNKRVWNAKIKEELNYTFRYPTFREGYAEEVRKAAFHN
jgi:nucleoside-diphosphate-sugar epimerase